MKNESIKTNLSYQIIYRILTIITPLITSPYLSRVLGVEKLGVFSATYAQANYFILIAMLGVEYYGNRTIAVCNSDKELKVKFWEILCSSYRLNSCNIRLLFNYNKSVT